MTRVRQGTDAVSDVAIRVESLSKCYRIGERHTGYQTLRESLQRALRVPFQRLRGGVDAGRARGSFIWALNGVSFDVARGEVVGVIGRNGAGKSTLLKILSRITGPTAGRAEIRGRVGSLLEVGTGFHPELSGRENVYLNGAILGMKRAEIDRQFDEIVAFAELAKMIDTPAKHYSSGMYVRLAFAVAAHLQPDILLLDEVFSVGDVEFQRKCMGRMERIAHEGKTVLVVSHSMSTVKALCSRALLLDRGCLRALGTVDAVVNEYLSSTRVDPAEKGVRDEDYVAGGDKMRLRWIRLVHCVENRFTVCWRQPIAVSLEVEVRERLDDVSFGAGILAIDGSRIFTLHDNDERNREWTFEPGRYVVDFTLENDLRPGIYKLQVGAQQRFAGLKNLFAVDAANIEVLDYAEDGTTPLTSNPGIVNGRAVWSEPKRVP